MSDGRERIDRLVAEHALRAPKRPALRDSEGRSLDWGSYHEAIEAFAALYEQRGIAAGDRVLIVAENSVATAAAIFAAGVSGAIAVPVNARMTGVEIGRVREHAAPCVTVFTTAGSEAARAHAEAADAAEVETPVGKVSILMDDRSAPCAATDAAEHAAGVADTADGQTAVILYTTGTTGAPKGVMLTHGNLCFAGRSSASMRGMVTDDLVYGVLPLTHVFGLASMLMACASCGACLQLEARFRPDRLLQALQSGVTVFPAVPQMHALVMQHASEHGLERLQGSVLRYVSSGAAPLDPAWKRRAEAFYGVALQNGYGMTETTAGICGTRSERGSDDISVGHALAGVDIKLDHSIGDAADVSVGEILTRGPHVMRGYYRNPEATRQVVDDDGWLRTGDLGRFDAEGRLHVVGRCKELIIRSGFNVYPPEVEIALNDHPSIVQAAVTGRRLRDGNEEVLAFVQCVDPEAFDEASVKAFVAERLASYKCPSRIVAVTALPAAATGKILKHRLLEVFADRLV